MKTPGINNKIFNVYLCEDWFNQTTQPLIPRITPRGKINYVCHRILHFFGCTPVYTANVIGEPTQEEGGIYRYPIKLMTKKIRLFGVVIKTINTDKI